MLVNSQNEYFISYNGFFFLQIMWKNNFNFRGIILLVEYFEIIEAGKFLLKAFSALYYVMLAFLCIKASIYYIFIIFKIVNYFMKNYKFMTKTYEKSQGLKSFPFPEKSNK